MTNSKKFRVLYAETNEDACLMVTVTLNFTNIDVVTAGTIADAWRLATAEEFNLYLLDNRFPDGCGFDLCRRLRKSAPQTPILFYSADAYETDKAKGLAAGANAYLTKPYFGDLAATIRQAIEKKNQVKLKMNLPYFETSARMCEAT